MIAIITLRKNSKRILDKNFLNIGGLPLFFQQLTVALNLEKIENIIISTDYERERLKLPENVFFHDRPRRLCQGNINIYDVIQCVIENFKQFDFEDILLLPANVYNNNTNIVSSAIEDYLVNQYTSYVPIRDYTDFSSWCFRMESNKLKRYKKIESYQSENLQKLYIETGAFHVMKKANIYIAGDLRGYGDKIGHIFDYQSIEIDTIEDYRRAMKG